MAYEALITSLDAPVGLIEGYTYPNTRSLVMNRSRMSFLGGCFNLHDENGQLLLNVDTSMRKGKSFTNPEGKEVLHSGTTVWTRATTITLPHIDPNSKERGKEVGWVKSNLMGKFKIGATFLDHTTGAEKVLGMKGDWKTNAKLVIDDEVVAVVERDKITSSTRRIRVAANIDVVLVFAAAVLFDQMVNDTIATWS